MEPSTSSTAVIARHFQDDIVGADGAFAPFFHTEVERRGVIDVAGRVLDAARNAGAQIVLAPRGVQGRSQRPRHQHPAARRRRPAGQPPRRQPRRRPDRRGQARADDWNLVNPEVSPFAASDLNDRLRAAGVDTVVLMGVASNISVESTGRAAGDLGYRVVIVEDACSTAAQEVHDASMATFGLLGEVVSSDGLIAAL